MILVLDSDPFYIDDYSDYVYFYCDEAYQLESCDEVSLTAYNGDYCSGQSSEIRLITNACIYSSGIRFRS